MTPARSAEDENQRRAALQALERQVERLEHDSRAQEDEGHARPAALVRPRRRLLAERPCDDGCVRGEQHRADDDRSSQIAFGHGDGLYKANGPPAPPFPAVPLQAVSAT